MYIYYVGLYINIFIHSIKYNNINISMYIQICFFKIYTECVCIYIYIINKHSTHTYIMYTNTFILDEISHD